MAGEKRVDKFIKIIGILLLLMLIPIGILTMIYNTNEKFKVTTNEQLRQFPGFIGQYFNRYPTENEKNDKIKYIAKHYINLDKTTAADKLYIVKKSDEELYLDIIQVMKLESLNKTEDVIKQVRNIELRKDTLVSIYDEMESEKEEELAEEYKRFDKLNIDIAILEIKNNYLKDYNNFEKLISIFKNIKKEKLVNILFYIDINSKDTLLNRIKIDDVSFHNEVQSMLIEKEKKHSKLQQIASMYEVMDSKLAFNDIGNTNKFSIDDLAVIYSYLEPKKSAEILINEDEPEFANQLFENIRALEELNGLTKSITVDITDELTKLNDYNNKKQELISIYEKMNSSEAAKLIEKMFITDPDIVIDVLMGIKKAKVSEILNNIETRKAIEISKRILN